MDLPFDFTGKPGSRATDCYDLPASIRGARDATLRKRRPATAGTISILSQGGTRVNTDPTKLPICRGREFVPPAVTRPPEGVHSDADHRSVRCSPSSHAANLPSRDRAPRFQSTPRLRRFIVTTRFNRRRPKRLAIRTDPIRRSVPIDCYVASCFIQGPVGVIGCLVVRAVDPGRTTLPPQPSNGANQSARYYDCRDDAANCRRPAFSAHHGIVTNKFFKLIWICRMSAVTGTDVLVAQFKAFRTATATVAVRNAAFVALFDLLDPNLAAIQAASATRTNSPCCSNSSIAAGTSDQRQLAHPATCPT